MKKRAEKALEYKLATSQKAVGVAVILICTIISNYKLFTGIKTSYAKLYLDFALLGLTLCIMGGICIALAVPNQLNPARKGKRKFSMQYFVPLSLFQFGSLIVAIFCIFSLLANSF